MMTRIISREPAWLMFFRSGIGVPARRAFEALLLFRMCSCSSSFSSSVSVREREEGSQVRTAFRIEHDDDEICRHADGGNDHGECGNGEGWCEVGHAEDGLGFSKCQMIARNARNGLVQEACSSK